MELSQYQELRLKKKLGLPEFLKLFSNNDQCLYLCFSIKYFGSICACGKDILTNYVRSVEADKYGNIKKAFKCTCCRRKIYPIADTIFKNTSIELSSIFFVIFIFCSKKSTSAMQVTRLIDISYKTSHRLMMIIRSIMKEYEDIKLQGVIEIDEVFIGKGSKVYNWSGISTRKQPIIGMINRHTKQLKVFLVKNRSKKILRELILKNVEVESTIYTDSWNGYNDLDIYYDHHSVDHTSREFVRGDVHTNTIENVWGVFKRNIRGAHIKISDKYVQQYMDELCWKYNRRNETEMIKFDTLIRRAFKAIPAR